MIGYYIAGAWLLLCAVVILTFAGASNLHRRNARFDASIAQTPEPVDRALWAPNAPLWENSATPIFDQLSAENLRAELDDGDAVARWLAGAS